MEEEAKKSFIEEHPRIVFWIRAILWTLFAGVLPFLFIAFRFDLFKKASAVSFSGWGIIGIIILAIFLIVLVRYIKKGFSSKNVFLEQCINGVCRVIIPLVALFVIIKVSVANLENFLEALGCTILCETVAIPLNPFPAWIKKNQTEDVLEAVKKVVNKGK